MQAVDLQSISAVAPRGDIETGVWLMLLGALAANAVVVPKLASSRLSRAIAFAVASSVGFMGAAMTLLAMPRKLYFASLLYVVAFFVIATLASRGLPERSSLRKRILAAVVLMTASIAMAWWITFAPR